MERQPARPRMSRRLAVVASVLVLFSGCAKPAPFGEANQIAVATSNEIWNALESEIVAALEPRIFTVRDERVFEVAYIQPAEIAETRLRRMRHVLLIGSAQEPVIAEALAGRDWEGLTLPVLIQLEEVWAQNQLVTVALLPEAAEPHVLEPLLPRIGELYLRRLGDHIRSQMAVTMPNERLAKRLRRAGGFTLEVPRTYDYRQLEPNLFVFRHEDPGTVPVIRTVLVDSRARGSVEWTAEGAGAWRAELAERLHQPPHVTETLADWMQGQVAGEPAIRIQGVWSTPLGEWPSAGPFISRMVECSDRVFLIDASLYSPGDEKYQYMYQLDMILDTFRCPVADPPPAGSPAFVMVSRTRARG